MAAADRFDAKVQRTPECWLWTGALVRKDGYGSFWNGERNETAHRFAWRAAHGEIPQGMNVLHRCDVPRCVNPEHLFLGTPADNTKDMIAKGRARHAAGDAHPARKLTSVQVAEIRAACARGMSQSEAGRQYGVSHRTIHLIVHNKIWKE